MVADAVLPMITCPGDLNEECIGDVPPAFTTFTDFVNGGGSATDNCGLDVSTFSVTEADNGTCPRTITRTYEIADSCGNTGQCVQMIIVSDITSPVMTCPGDLNEECIGDVPPAFTTLADFINGGGSAMDNCGLDASTFLVTETDNGTCPDVYKRQILIQNVVLPSPERIQRLQILSMGEEARQITVDWMHQHFQ